MVLAPLVPVFNKPLYSAKGRLEMKSGVPVFRMRKEGCIQICDLGCLLRDNGIVHADHFRVAGWNGSCCCVSTYISVLQNHSKLTGYDKLMVSRAV
jgi:hypothetical protein